MHRPVPRERTGVTPALISVALLATFYATALQAQDPVGECTDLPEHLAACEAYECAFTHPFTGSEETRAVAPEEGGLCLYRESMPNDGEMTCRYDEAGREEMAAFYRASFDAMASGEAPPDNDVLNAAMADGTCRVSGY